MLTLYTALSLLSFVGVFIRYIKWSTTVLEEATEAHCHLVAWLLDNPDRSVRFSPDGLAAIDAAIRVELRLRFTFLKWHLFFDRTALNCLYDLKYEDLRPDPPPTEGLPPGSPLSIVRCPAPFS